MSASASSRSLALFGPALLCAVLAPGVARAQSASVSMTASRNEVAVGETFQIQVRVDASGEQAPEPPLPDLSMFTLVREHTSRSMSMSFGMGQAQQVSTVARVAMVRAERPGTFEIPAPRVVVGGRAVPGNALTIVVRGSGATPTTPSTPSTNQQVPATRPEPPTGALDGAVYDDQAFLRTVVDRSEAYVGQQVTVTLYLYVRAALRAVPPITREASTDGFWVHDLLGPTHSFDATVQQVGSTTFRVYTLRRFAAFPLREGELTIGAPTAQIPMGSVFDVFLGGQSADVERTGVPVRITARPLPAAGRPAGPVHVGQIGLEASLDRTQVPTGDAVTLTVRATGTGQIESLRLNAPALDGLRVLAPQTRDQMSSPGDVVGGTRVFEWLMVPEREGTYRIPPFRVATFDPATERYGVAETAPIELIAAGNPVASSAPSGGAADDEAPSAGSEEFGPVRTTSALARGHASLAEQAWYPWALGAFPAAWLGLAGALLMQRRRAARAGRTTPQQVAKQARQRLAHAESLAAKDDARGLYAALTLALKAVIEGRLGESIGSLTQRQLERRMVARGMDEALARRVVEELEGHEMMRFSASGAQPSEMQAALARARELIGELDRFVARPAEEER